ncbi:MAG: hydrogenase small subunit [Thermoanaerobaculales bacterium]|nr:hydrogenase small subunit [Thermoanaerobaculales bacterium]
MGRREELFDLPVDLPEEGVDRRDFVKVCMMAAAALGLPAATGVKWAQAAEAGLKPSVVWLHFQECTGCTESLLRTSHPSIATLILDMVSLDYHETLFAAAGHQIEDALHAAVERGGYVCVVEGAIPTKDDGVYCQIGGRTAIDILKEVGGNAAAIIAIGSCASWGGIPSADPNPTGAVGAHEILPDKTIVNLPGCPSNPYNFLGVVLQFATMGTLPALDDEGRPLFAYGRTIHEHCPRRAHFDAGRFARQFGDEGHNLGYCLFALGCKGPETYANCSTLHFNEVPDAWPIGIGAPCFGCTTKGVGFTKPLFAQAALPANYVPPIHAADQRGPITPGWAGVVGLATGAAVGGALMASKKLGEGETEG